MWVQRTVEEILTTLVSLAAVEWFCRHWVTSGDCQFNKIDADGNGKLTGEEIRQFDGADNAIASVVGWSVRPVLFLNA